NPGMKELMYVQRQQDAQRASNESSDIHRSFPFLGMPSLGGWHRQPIIAQKALVGKLTWPEALVTSFTVDLCYNR
ncbi:MAG: hypothetical protein WBB22_01195, partial [Anaerolineae bacterium]